MLPIRVAACHQCLHLDSSSGRFIWVYPPEEFINHLSDLVCFTLEDHPGNKFFNKAYPFLPADLRGAFQLHKQSGHTKEWMTNGTVLLPFCC